MRVLRSVVNSFNFFCILAAVKQNKEGVGERGEREEWGERGGGEGEGMGVWTDLKEKKGV